jgi:hypothetical protein
LVKDNKEYFKDHMGKAVRAAEEKVSEKAHTLMAIAWDAASMGIESQTVDPEVRTKHLR